LTVCGQRPIGDQIELGFSGTIAVGSNVMANMFNSIGEEFALLQLECNAVFDEDVADAFKKVEERCKNSGPEQDVINNDATAKVRSRDRVTRAIKRLPFATENAHHTSAEGGSVARTERHHRPTAFVIVRSGESNLFLVLFPKADLVVAGLVVQPNATPDCYLDVPVFIVARVWWPR
jgi:hypothetical protein